MATPRPVASQPVRPSSRLRGPSSCWAISFAASMREESIASSAIALPWTGAYRQARATIHCGVVRERNGLIKKSDTDRRLAARTKIEGRKLAARVVDDPPTVFIRRRLVTIKLNEPKLGVTQFVCPEAAWSNLKLFFDLRTVDGMAEIQMESVTDNDRVGDPLLFRVQGQTDDLSCSRAA